MQDIKEFAHEFDVSQFDLPYEDCSEEEKDIRRYIIIRIESSIEENKRKGINIDLSDEII